MRTIIELRSEKTGDRQAQQAAGKSQSEETAKESPVKQKAQQKNSQWKIHVVKPGETLFSIARQEYGNGHRYKKIMRDNKLQNPSITAGQRLKIEK